MSITPEQFNDATLLKKGILECTARAAFFETPTPDTVTLADVHDAVTKLTQLPALQETSYRDADPDVNELTTTFNFACKDFYEAIRNAIEAERALRQSAYDAIVTTG